MNTVIPSHSIIKQEQELQVSVLPKTPENMSSSNFENNENEQAKKYSVISQDARSKFINLVITKQKTIKEAAQECGIKFSTSKAILKTFKKEGRIGKKSTRVRKTKVINTIIIAQIDSAHPEKPPSIPLITVNESKVPSSMLYQKDGHKGSAMKLDQTKIFGAFTNNFLLPQIKKTFTQETKNITTKQMANTNHQQQQFLQQIQATQLMQQNLQQQLYQQYQQPQFVPTQFPLQQTLQNNDTILLTKRGRFSLDQDSLVNNELNQLRQVIFMNLRSRYMNNKSTCFYNDICQKQVNYINSNLAKTFMAVGSIKLEEPNPEKKLQNITLFKDLLQK